MKHLLLDKISDQAYLLTAWNRINKSNPASRGISDEKIADFRNNLLLRIESISSSLKSRSYKFSPTRAALLPKKTGGFRPLQIPEVKDRIVIKALSLVIEEIFEEKLAKCRSVSFAYQKNLGIRQATEKIRKLIKQKNYFVLEVDLEDFFGTISKNELIEKSILPVLDDSSINSLIIQSLNQKIEGIENVRIEYQSKFENLNRGIPQGNALSPLLSNIYLQPFDQLMIQKKINLVRYADDFVILAPTKKAIQIAFNLCEEVLEKQLKLKIHKEGEKAYKISNISKSTFEFLSIEHSLNNCRPSKKAVQELLNKIKEETEAATRKKNLQIALFKTKWILDGWSSAFYFSDIENHEERIDKLVNRHVYRVFEKLGFKLKNIDKLPYHLRVSNNSNYCLSDTQRKNSGIPLIKDLWIERKQKAIDKEIEKLNKKLTIKL